MVVWQVSHLIRQIWVVYSKCMSRLAPRLGNFGCWGCVHVWRFGWREPVVLKPAGTSSISENLDSSPTKTWRWHAPETYRHPNNVGRHIGAQTWKESIGYKLRWHPALCMLTTVLLQGLGRFNRFASNSPSSETRRITTTMDIYICV